MRSYFGHTGPPAPPGFDDFANATQYAPTAVLVAASSGFVEQLKGG